MERQDRYCDLRSLLTNTPLAYYWLGYIMADGWFDHKKKAISVCSSITDLKHLKKYATYVKAKAHKEPKLKKSKTNLCFYSKTKVIYKVTARHTEVVNKLIARFNLLPKKTYNPPDLTSIIKNEKLFVSFFAGFIDGDGCISSQPKWHKLLLRIQVHKSWLRNIKLMENKIYEITGITKNKYGKKILTRIKKGTIYLEISRYEVIYGLYRRVMALHLPVLKRKWDKIAKYPVPKRYREWILNDSKPKSVCSIGNCNRVHFAKGYCHKHWYRICGKYTNYYLNLSEKKKIERKEKKMNLKAQFQIGEIK